MTGRMIYPAIIASALSVCFAHRVGAVATYDAYGFGRVTILSWTDETLLPSFDPLPPGIMITQNQAVDIVLDDPPADPIVPEFQFDPQAGDVGSVFSLETRTRGDQLTLPPGQFVESFWAGSADLEIDNENPLDMLVDIQLDWQITVSASTDAASQDASAFAAISLFRYTGLTPIEEIRWDTRFDGNGSDTLSGSDTFTVRIPAEGMDEIKILIDVFGEAEFREPITGTVPEPLTAGLGIMSLVTLGYNVQRRKRGR